MPFLRKLWASGLAACLASGLWAEGPARAIEVAILHPRPPASDTDRALRGPVLDADDLAALALARSPRLKAAAAFQQARGERAVQERSWMDPVLSYALAPQSLSSEMRTGWSLRLEQSIPFPGRTSLRGRAAELEAAAAGGDRRALELAIAAEAYELYADYYGLAREAELLEKQGELLRALQASALARHQAGKASRGPALMAEVELHHTHHGMLKIAGRQAEVLARMDALLDRRGGANLPQLPPPVAELPLLSGAENEDEAVKEALRSRPEIAALRARRGAALTRVDLARRERFPDLMFMAEQSTFMEEADLRFALGVSVALPLRFARRSAMVRESNDEAQLLHYELAAAEAAITGEVRRALADLHSACDVAANYATNILPTARDWLDSARLDYEAGRAELREVIEAARHLHEAEFGRHEALAGQVLARARLDAARGRMPGRATTVPVPLDSTPSPESDHE